MPLGQTDLIDSTGATAIVGTGTNGVLSGGVLTTNAVPVAGTQNTYSAAITGLVTAALATDIFTISGSATKVVKVTHIDLSATTTTASGSSVSVQLVKRSTLDSGGTSSIIPGIPHVTANPSATAVAKSYTANPTLGTAIGLLRSFRFEIPSVGAAGAPLTWEFGTRPSQAIELVGVNEQFCLNFNATSVTGPVVDLSIEWTEE